MKPAGLPRDWQADVVVLANRTPAEPLTIETPPPPPPGPTLAVRARRWLDLNRQRLIDTVIGAGAVLVALIGWHLLSANHVDLYVRFENVPSPGQVLDATSRQFSSGAFLVHVLASCRRIFIGFALAALVAIPTGLVMGRYRLARAIVFPLAEIFRPIPAIAWVPISIMLWPTSEESILFITFIGSFFPILVNTLHGVDAIDPVLVRAARCLGAGEITIFREVYLQSALPQIFTGLTVGMGVAWISLIAAEMISGQYGIGYFTWQAYSLVDYPNIVLGMISIGALGLFSSGLIRFLGKLLMPWRAGR
ncbi:ABC transporter permease [Sphingomonas mali]|uniref:ABC transporter permease n=1 Tax=Sphingomonas mali TaxID=40682 RepID=UPI000A055435|nr:ABC transporter permease [Sphingomonas mali]